MCMQMYVQNVHVRSSYITLIGVHEIHGRMHPNQGHVTNLFPLTI